MAILRGDVPGAWFSGDEMQHISLDRHQPVDYLSPGPSNGLINHFRSFGVTLNVQLRFVACCNVWLGVREVPEAKFRSGIRVKLRDMLGFGVLVIYFILPCPAVLSSSKSCLHARTFILFSFSSHSSTFIIFPSGSFTTSLFTFQVLVQTVHNPYCLKCQLCKTLYVCSRSVLMFVSTHPVSYVPDVSCSHCLVFVTQRVLV